MVAGTGKGNEAAAMNQTTMELKGDREILIARTFNAPARIVFDAYTTPELRDTIIASGMESGMRVTMDQLEALVATLE